MNQTTPHSDSELLALSARNSERAHNVLRHTGLLSAWQAAGATIHPVGSLRMGLLMLHRDIDLHCYTDTLSPAESLRLMGQVASHTACRRMWYINSADTEEACLEWHLTWFDSMCDDEEWNIDLIQIRCGSRYDGYFERMADRIAAALTDESRLAILRLKYETPIGEAIAGIEYYQAVLRDGVRTWDEFAAWRRAHPMQGIVEWMP